MNPDKYRVYCKYFGIVFRKFYIVFERNKANAVKAETLRFAQSDGESGRPRASAGKHSTKPQSFALKKFPTYQLFAVIQIDYTLNSLATIVLRKG